MKPGNEFLKKKNWSDLLGKHMLYKFKLLLCSPWPPPGWRVTSVPQAVGDPQEDAATPQLSTRSGSAALTEYLPHREVPRLVKA